MKRTSPDRAEILHRTDLARLATELLGLDRPCPGRHGEGRRPGLVIEAGGARPRWRCPGCGDGGTAVDLLALARGIGADEAMAQLGRLAARAPTAIGPGSGATSARRLPTVDVVVVTADGEQELAVDALAGSTVGDLAVAVLGRPTPLAIDGVVVGVGEGLAASGLREGSVVTAVQPDDVAGAAAVELRWVHGIDAGRVDRLPAGQWVVGSSPLVGVHRLDAGAAQAAVLEVGGRGEVRAEALRPGLVELATGADRRDLGVLRVGGGQAVVRALTSCGTGEVPTSRTALPPGRWTRPLVRRTDGGEEPALDPPAPAVPAPDSPPSKPATPSLVAPLLSLAAGVVLAVVARQPLLLILGGVGALGAVGTWAWQRARYARAQRRHRRAHADAVRQHDAAAAAWQTADRHRLTERHPDLAMVAERIAQGGGTLWRWRASAESPLSLAVGHAGPDPIVAELGPGDALAVVGPPEVTRAIARGLVVRLAADHRPADLCIDVRGATRDSWSWTDWLPHVAAREVTEAPDEPEGSAPARLLLLDSPTALESRSSDARRQLAAGAVAIVLAEPGACLPHVCRQLLTVAVAPGDVLTARLEQPYAEAAQAGFPVAGVSPSTALALARRLAAWHDPEQADAGALPAAIGLSSFLGPQIADAQATAAAWAAGAPSVGGSLRTPLGVAEDGTVDVDLVADGPHALVAGTTGAGKSELLRSLVAGLAALHPPSEVTFLLIDYKGGSAFDACARLPHVAGMVTDLDGHLGERVLRSLEAEVRRREEILRAAGCDDIASARRQGSSLARLVVVIDEFATVAAELPDVLRSIVNVARRGRSLGVHLVLATQRPGTAVSDEIRANTNLRIALRVQDAAASKDVVGVAAAAHLPRAHPGRAVVRLGEREHVVIQTAQVTAPGRPAATVVVRPRRTPFDRAAGPTDLDDLVGVLRRAAALVGEPPPHRPWLDPLPSRLELSDLPNGSIALADRPAEQRQARLGWDRGRGHLLLYGGPGAGTTTALAALAFDLARTASPDDLHLLVVDLGGRLAPLAGLAHVGAVVAPTDEERLVRVVRVLDGELQRRRACDIEHAEHVEHRGTLPELVVLVDGLAAWRDAIDDPRREVLDILDRVLAEGPRHGIVMAATADRAGSVPLALAAVTAQKWVFEPADHGELAGFGLRATDAPAWQPGRFVDVAERVEAQCAIAGDLAAEVDAVRGAWPTPRRPAPSVGILPDRVLMNPVSPRPRRDDAVELILGLGDELLEPASIVVHPGDHVLVAGPARSGRSTGLAVVAAAVRAACPRTWIGAVLPRRSALGPVGLDVVATTVEGLGPLPSEGWLLIDDAELVDDPGQVLSGRLARAEQGLRVVAAGRTDALRSGYGHWTQLVRRSRLGVLLQPDPLVDGDLLGVLLPRLRPPRRVPGRGWLVADGRVELVQLAAAADDQAEAADPRGSGVVAIDRRAAASTARAPAVLAGPAARIIAAPASERVPASA